MKSVSIFFSILLIGLIGCTGTRHIDMVDNPEDMTQTPADMLQMAETAFQEKDYQKSFEICEELISDPAAKQFQERGRIYELAGNSAFALEQYDKAQVYLETALNMNSTSELTYLNLISIFQKIENVSREITLLQIYIKQYPAGEEIDAVRERLFQTCQVSMNYDFAVSLWPLLEDQARSDISNLELFLEINQELGNDSVCDRLAKTMLEQNPDNKPALEWVAEKYYWRAENRYQSEMSVYNKNKTRTQYDILVEALKTVTLDFKESLGYFTRLYELYHDSVYARYLGNIYARLSDEKKALYYHGLAR